MCQTKRNTAWSNAKIWQQVRLTMLRNIRFKNAQITLFPTKNRGRRKMKHSNPVASSSTSLFEHIETNKKALRGLWKKFDLQDHVCKNLIKNHWNLHNSWPPGRGTYSKRSPSGFPPLPSCPLNDKPSTNHLKSKQTSVPYPKWMKRYQNLDTV
jgi:hypothetical protein